MPDNIYPDLTNSQYDIKYAKRKVLASDLKNFGRPNQLVTETRIIETEDNDPDLVPGIDSVLAVGQFLTADRNIEAAGFNLEITSGGNDIINIITSSGQINYGQYGEGTFEAAPAYMLAVDAIGNIIEVDPASLFGSDDISETDPTVHQRIKDIPVTDDPTEDLYLHWNEVSNAYERKQISYNELTDIPASDGFSVIRFGVATEDDTAGEQRQFDTGTAYSFKYLSSGSNTPLIAQNTRTGMTDGLGSAFKMEVAQSSASLSAELNTAPDGWTVSGSFVSSGGGVYTGTSSGGSISFDLGAVAVGDIFLIGVKALIGQIYITLGGVTTVTTATATTEPYGFHIQTVNTSGVITIVTTTATGATKTLSDITIKKVLGNTPPIEYTVDPNGIAYELRADKNSGNFFLGANAGLSAVDFANGTDTFGKFNIGIGIDALKLNTQGTGNVAIGYQALSKNISHYESIAIGFHALRDATVSLSNESQNYGNVAIGFQALRALTTGHSNLAIGRNTLIAITTQTNNTAIGFHCLQNAQSSGNTAIGSFVMQGTVTGNDNVGVGYAISQSLSSGSNNVSMGRSAGGSLTTGHRNTNIGSNAGHRVATGSENTMIGAYTLQGTSNAYSTDGIIVNRYNAADNNLVFVGAYVEKDLEAGDAVTTNSIGIGHHVRVYQSNQAVIGNVLMESMLLRGDTEIINYNDRESQTLADHNFPAATTKWSVTGAFSLQTGFAQFDASAGTPGITGTLKQVAADFAEPAQGNRWYRLRIHLFGTTYTLPGNQAVMELEVSNSTFCQVVKTVANATNGDLIWFFRSNAAPTELEIKMTLTAINTSTGIAKIDLIELQEINGGDLDVNGLLKLWRVAKDHDYADQATAEAAGLTYGQIYHTGGTLKIIY